MEDLPKPVWDLLAQKIDDAKTWFSFVQVSRLTRFLGKKYKKEKQNQFSYFYYDNNNIYYEKVMPNKGAIEGTDVVWVGGCEGSTIAKITVRNGLTYYITYASKYADFRFPRVFSYTDLKKCIRQYYTLIVLNFNGIKISTTNTQDRAPYIFTAHGGAQSVQIFFMRR